MDILSNEAFGSRCSIRSLKAPVTGARTALGYSTPRYAASIQKNRPGGEPGNPLPCRD